MNKKNNNSLQPGAASESIKEALSAMADDELAADEQVSDSDIVELACCDAEVRAAWQCMHITRDVMHADYHSALDAGFAARLAQKIDREEAPHQSTVVPMTNVRDTRTRRPNSKRASRTSTQTMPFEVWKPVAGLGLAASLAGAVFMLPQMLDSKDAGNSQVAQTPTTERAVSGLQTVAFNQVNSAGTHWRMDSQLPRNQQIESKLNALLTNHLEDASMGRVHGMLAHSRVVSYDTTNKFQGF